VRWLCGHPEILLRFRGNYLEAFGRLTVPANLGTPGARNSRAILNAGPTKVDPAKNPQLSAKLKEIYEDTGKRWEADEDEYDHYIARTPCPFVKDKKCTIYPYRPDGCRQFPNTPFGMLSEDCGALDRFKKQAIALCRGRRAMKAVYFTSEPIKQAKFSEKQYKDCLGKLRKTGITEDEMALFRSVNNR
jgi:Fe-S-cluster containining protein